MKWLWAGLIFAGLVGLLWNAFPRRRVSKRRLGIERERLDLGQSVDKVLGAGRARRLAQAIELADVSTPVGTFVLRILVGSLLVGILGVLVSPLVGLTALVLPYFVVRAWLSYKGRRRQEKFAEQLPDFLQSLTTTLRSGFALSQALNTVLEQAEEPIRGEIQRALLEVRAGRDLSDALRSLAKRMKSDDLDWVVGAVDINRETGGNLSEILTTVNGTILQRQRLQRKVRTLTAEGRLSARILTVLPFLVGIWQWIAHPDDFAALFQGAGLILIFGCAGLMAVGLFWIRRIVTMKL